MSGPLVHSPAAILRQLLIDLTQGTTPSDNDSWPMHYSSEPDTPDNAITVYDTAGTPDGRTMIDGRVHEHSGAQVRVRAQSESVGFTKAQAIATAMAEDVSYAGVIVESTSYKVDAISRISGPLSLGKEPGSKRNIFTINVTMAVKQVV